MSNSRSPRAVRSITIGIRGMSWRLVRCREDDGAALEGAGSEVGQGLLGFVELVGCDCRADRDLGGEREELLAVLAGEVGHRADAALVPEVLVREARDVTHVDAGTYHGAAGSQGGQCPGDQLAGAGEDDRGVELLGGL